MPGPPFPGVDSSGDTTSVDAPDTLAVDLGAQVTFIGKTAALSVVVIGMSATPGLGDTLAVDKT